ncbi:MAG: MFS transporter [Chloroflexi bacterium]|nr:MFS transporter [Chloroflexota bacterium]MBV9546170.1 MFS transporter [Chloroflexota bacterium]
MIGLLYSTSGIVTAILVTFSGVLADRFGRRRFLILGTALPIISYAIFALTTDSAWLVVASVLGGVDLANGAAGAMTAASFDALLAEHTAPQQRTAAFSWSQALWSVALSLGSLAAGLPVLVRDDDTNRLTIVTSPLHALGTTPVDIEMTVRLPSKRAFGISRNGCSASPNYAQAVGQAFAVAILSMDSRLQFSS